MQTTVPASAASDTHVATQKTSKASISTTLLRTWHSNVSAFIAPMVIFFSLSGALQLVNLHKAQGNYKPNALISAVSRLHKDQLLAPELARKPPNFSGTKRTSPPAEPPMKLGTILLKALFLVESVALATTTLLGAWIGLTHPKRARACWILLGAGTLIPIVLLFF